MKTMVNFNSHVTCLTVIAILMDLIADCSGNSRSYQRLTRYRPKQELFGQRIKEFVSVVPQHEVSGEMFTADRQALWIRDFHYTPSESCYNVHFWVGLKEIAGPLPDTSGVAITDELGSVEPLRQYQGESFTLGLPYPLENVAWLSVWCLDHNVDIAGVLFFDVKTPAPIAIQRPLKGQHGIRTRDVDVPNHQTIILRSLYYDGKGPKTQFMAGSGEVNSRNGFKLINHRGKLNYETLPQYNGEDITLLLPPDKSIYDFDWISIYDLRFSTSFATMQLPSIK